MKTFFTKKPAKDAFKIIIPKSLIFFEERKRRKLKSK